MRSSSSRAFAHRSAWTTPASRCRVRCSSVWRAATTSVLRRSRTGTFRRLPAPARFARRRTICFKFLDVCLGNRRYAAGRRHEDDACRAPSEGPSSAMWLRAGSSASRFERRDGLEGWRHRRLCHVHRLFDEERGETSILLSNAADYAANTALRARIWSTRHTRSQNFAARCRSIRRCSQPMPAATRYRRPSS